MSRYNRRIISEAVPIHIAKARLSKFIARTEAGEEIVITRRDIPVAKLVALAPSAPRPKRVPGSMRGQFTIGPEFFEPMSPEELDLWYK